MYIYILLLALPLWSAASALALHLPYLVGIILFYYVPGLVLDLYLRPWTSAVRHTIISAIIAVPFAIVVDYIGTRSALWYVPHSVLSWRLFGTIPIEDMLWLSAALYLITSPMNIVKNPSVVSKSTMRRLIWFVGVSILGIAGTLASQAVRGPLVFHSRWTYTVLTVAFFVAPTIAASVGRRFGARQGVAIVIYFMFCTAFFELDAAILNWWTFPGAYVLADVSAFGVRVPVEELLFVGLLGPISGIMICKRIVGD